VTLKNSTLRSLRMKFFNPKKKLRVKEEKVHRCGEW
jgi:hypothetical protein